MATEETLRLIVKTEIQNALSELTNLKVGIQQAANATENLQDGLGGFQAFEEAFKRFKDEAAKAKEVQDSFNAALAKTPDDENLKSFGKSMKYIEDGKPAVDNLTQGFGNLVQALGLLQIAQKALQFGADMVEAWGQQEQAVKRLNAALSIQGRSLESKGLQKFASSMQAATGFGDELTLSLLGSYAALGRSEDQLKSMATAAADLAAGSGMSLNQAMDALNLTLDGQARGLGATVPAVRELTEEQLRNGDAIKMVSELYKGQAATAMGTLQGKISALSGEFGDMQEALFDSFAPLIKGIVDGLRSVVGFITGMPEPVRTFAVALGVLAAAGVGVVGALTAFNLIKPALMASFAQLTGGATTFWGAMTGPIGWAALIITGLAAVVTAIISATDSAAEQTREYASAMQETTDQAEKLRLTTARIREVERSLAEDRRHLQGAPVYGRYSAVIERQIAEREAELSSLNGILRTVRENIQTAESKDAAALINAAGRAKEEAFVREAAERLSFLDRYKTDLERKQAEIVDIDKKIVEASGVDGHSASRELVERANRDLIILRRIRAQTVAELSQMRREASLSEFDRMYAAYLQNIEILNRRSLTLGWDETARLAEVAKLAGQFSLTAAELAGLTDRQKEIIKNTLSLSITPSLNLNPFTESFEKWQEAQSTATKMREGWDRAMASASTDESREQLEEYGKSLGYISDEVGRLKQLAEEVEGLLANAFGDVGEISGSILSRLLSEDDLDRLKEHLKEFGEAYGATYDAITRTVGMFFDQMQDMQIANLESELSRLEEQLSAHDEYVDQQMTLREEAGKSTVDFEINAAKEREDIEKNLAKKKAEIAMVEFKNKQASAAGEAAINTAVEATKALSNPFLLALVLAAGALQQGMIWSQKPPEVPAFYDGGYFPGTTAGTIGRFGENNQAEVVLPLRKQKLEELGLTGGGSTFNFYLYGSDPRETALQVSENIERLKREGYLN